MKQTVRSETRVAEAVKSMKMETDSLITLSTGVVLKPTRVPNMVFLEVTRRFEAPKIPRMMNEDLGREEENPNDPEYIEAYNRYQADLSVAIIDTLILMGTEIHTIPAGVFKPEEDGWTRKLRALKINPGEDEMERYLMWVKYYVASEDKDINKIVESVGRLSGVSEEDVTEAINQFRDIP